MFKGSQDNQDWLNRTGSHATRPLSNGSFSELPSWAKEPEEYFNTIKQQWESILEQLHRARETAHATKLKLKNTLPRQEYDRLIFKYEHEKTLLLELERSSGDYRALVRAAALNAFGTVYMLCADRILDVETKMKLEKEVKEILGRIPSDGIDNSRLNRSPEQILHETRRKNKQQRFKNSRDKRKGENGSVVWSDEKGGLLSTPKRGVT
jgi:hypothetical protein